MTPARVASVAMMFVVLLGALFVEASRQGHRELEMCQAAAPAEGDPTMVGWVVERDYTHFQLACTLENDDGSKQRHWRVPMWQWPP